MRVLGSIPPALDESGSHSAPPTGGLAMVLGGSFLFWAAMLWIVLRIVLH